MKNIAFRASGYTCVSNYQLTILDNRGLIERLTMETSFAVDQLRQAWPELRSDPVDFGLRLLKNARSNAIRFLHRPRTLLSGVAAIMIVSSAVLLVVITPTLQPVAASDLELVQMISLDPASAITTKEASGVGANSNGRVGVARRSGEGSRPEPKKSRGGGSSGKQDNLPPQHGQLLPPSSVPAPLFKPPKNPVLPQAGIDIDPALWAQPLLQYGDPRPASTALSHGPGDGGNFGSAKGFGTGGGDGNGFGPGTKGNTGDGERQPGGGGIGGSNGNNDSDGPDRVRKVAEVTQRARILLKPEPQYTEEARRNQITGTVVLRVVFSATGQVINIRTVNGLPFGLTEKAITAARQIRFLPAMKTTAPCLSLCSWNITSIFINRDQKPKEFRIWELGFRISENAAP